MCTLFLTGVDSSTADTYRSWLQGQGDERNWQQSSEYIQSPFGIEYGEIMILRYTRTSLRIYIISFFPFDSISADASTPRQPCRHGKYHENQLNTMKNLMF